jgi:serine phosphatase RsbU (regulator of sigma subunit)
MMVVRKVISLLAEGVRDGAAARAASDRLYTERNGKVSCTLNIASIDLSTNTVVLSRNNPSPIYIARGDEIDCMDTESSPLGIRRSIRPVITEVELKPGLTIVMYTDGLTHAGKRRGQPMDVCNAIQAMLDEQDPSPQELADALLAHAVNLDEGRPADDISVVTLKVSSREDDEVRRMSVRLPLR